MLVYDVSSCWWNSVTIHWAACSTPWLCKTGWPSQHVVCGTYPDYTLVTTNYKH